MLVSGRSGNPEVGLEDSCVLKPLENINSWLENR